MLVDVMQPTQPLFSHLVIPSEPNYVIDNVLSAFDRLKTHHQWEVCVGTKICSQPQVTKENKDISYVISSNRMSLL